MGEGRPGNGGCLESGGKHAKGARGEETGSSMESVSGRGCEFRMCPGDERGGGRGPRAGAMGQGPEGRLGGVRDGRNGIRERGGVCTEGRRQYTGGEAEARRRGRETRAVAMMRLGNDRGREVGGGREQMKKRTKGGVRGGEVGGRGGQTSDGGRGEGEGLR